MLPSADALLTVDPAVYKTAFNNTPFSFKHYLHQLPMFQPEALAELAKKYGEKPGGLLRLQLGPHARDQVLRCQGKTVETG